MIHVDFDPERLSGEQRAWFEDWQTRAQVATVEVFERWQQTGSVTFTVAEQKLWAELKKWLLDNVFAHKCAYCERELYKQGTDAEHYRPKAGVKYARSQGYSTVEILGADGVPRLCQGRSDSCHRLRPAL